MRESQCQQEAAAAAVTHTVQHLLAPHVEPAPLALQLVINQQLAVGAERLDQLQQQFVQQLSARRRFQKRAVNHDWLQTLQVLMLEDVSDVQSELQLRTPSFPRQLWLPWLQLPLQPVQPHKVLPVLLLGPSLET